METDASNWLLMKAEPFLKRIGIREGQEVLDFGCNEGNYTLPAARIVGESGKVYALDKNKQALDKLMDDARNEGLRNIERLHVTEDQDIPLSPRSVDVVLFYDTLHGGYFPEAAQRREALRRTCVLLSDSSQEIRDHDQKDAERHR